MWSSRFGRGYVPVAKGFTYWYLIENYGKILQGKNIIRHSEKSPGQILNNFLRFVRLPRGLNHYRTYVKYSQYCSDFIDSLLCHMLQCLWSIKSYAVGMNHAYPRSVIVASHQASSISLLGSVYALCVRQSVNEACYQSASMCPCQLSFHQCSTFVHQSYGV